MRRTIFYRIGVLLVAGAMVVLPVVYVALIVLLGWGVYWHATENTHIASMGHGRARIVSVTAYLAPIVAGALGVLFLLKPLLARPSQRGRQISLTRAGQPHLYALVESICDAVQAPRPSRIDVDFDINASARFGGGLLGLVRSDLVLTIGLPLAAGLSLQQFAGVLAHEFGHFSQGAAMRLSWIVRSIHSWFARAAFDRDEWDDWLVETSEELDLRVGWVFYLARLVVALSRLILCCFLLVSNLLCCWLARQMEFDADRYEARLVGSQTFAETCFRLRLLEFGMTQFLKHLRVRPSSGNPVRDAVAYCEALDEPDLHKLRRRIERQKTNWFDTHPADAVRIANVNQEPAQGVFCSDLPAEAVFLNFDRLCLSLLQL